MAKQLTTDDLYAKAKQLMNSEGSLVKNSDKAKVYKLASKRFDALGDFKDSKELSQECLKRAEEFSKKKDELPPAPVNPLDQKKRSLAGIILVRVLIVALIAFVAWQVYARTTTHGRYLRACLYETMGNHNKAYNMFVSLKDYKDSPERVSVNAYKYGVKKYNKKDYTAAIKAFRKSLYYKDTNKLLTNAELKIIKKTKVENDVLYGEAHWVIVKKTKHKVFLIKTKPINGVPYNEEEKDVTWKTSSVREYINGSYARQIFTPEMMNKIVTTKVVVDDNSIYGTKGCVTKDKLFFLNSLQAYKYAMVGDLKKFRRDFWLIGPGERQCEAQFFSFGQSMESGYNVTTPYINIRPAMWVKYK